ncbi:MAG: GNAT family N-acetyltransferase [Pseudomonadota bacterium]
MIAPDTLQIRPAGPQDATALAQLIDIAGEGIPNWLWTRACTEGQTPLEVGAERAKRATGGFSHTNAMLAETGGAPLGMVLSYAITEAPEENPDDLPDPIAPFVALEKHSVDTWYINALAVFETVRGQGLGSRLMRRAEELALTKGFKEMSIQVYGENTGAVGLYERLGFRFVTSAPVRLHPSPPYYTGDVLLLKKPIG